MKKSLNIRGIILLGFATIISSNPMEKAYGSDLWEIYQLALANDPIYQAEILNRDASILDLPISKTAFRPSVTASGQLGRERTDVTGPTENNDDNFANLNLNLPLYDRAKKIAIQQSKQRVRIAELQLKQAKQDLILRVANRYFTVLAAQDAREVTRLEKIAIKRQMDLASERLDVGLGTRTDFFDAKARFKQAEADEIQAQNLINNEIARLKEIIGIYPEQLSTLSESAPLQLPQPNNVEDWVAQSANNISLAIQTLNLEISLDEIQKQKSARSATVDFNGNYRWSDSGSNFTTSSGLSISGETTTTRVGVSVQFPLYQGGMINLRTQQAGLLYNREESLLEQTKRSASTETTTAFLAVVSRISQAEALFDAITAGEGSLEAKTEGFNAGLTTNIDVLDAQRDLSRSRTDHLRARYDYILSVLDLESAVGDLNEEDINRVNSWL